MSGSSFFVCPLNGVFPQEETWNYRLRTTVNCESRYAVIQIFSGLPSSCPCVIFTSWVHIAFGGAVFPCKGSADRCHTNKQATFWEKLSRQPSTDCTQSGYSMKFLAEFLGLVPLVSATLIPARKKTQSDTKSMTTENFETHG